MLQRFNRSPRFVPDEIDRSMLIALRDTRGPHGRVTPKPIEQLNAEVMEAHPNLSLDGAGAHFLKLVRARMIVVWNLADAVLDRKAVKTLRRLDRVQDAA